MGWGVGEEERKAGKETRVRGELFVPGLSGTRDFWDEGRQSPERLPEEKSLLKWWAYSLRREVA